MFPRPIMQIVGSREEEQIMKPTSPADWPTRIAAGIALVFGVLTIISGGRVLFAGDEVRAAAGHVVPFVLWFNFLSGFVYVVAGFGLALRRRWAPRLAIILAAAIAFVFALFALHVFRGGAYETRTVGAMTLRLAVWVVIAAVAVRRRAPIPPARSERR